MDGDAATGGFGGEDSLNALIDLDAADSFVNATEVSDGIPVHFVDGDTLLEREPPRDLRGNDAVGAPTRASLPPLLARTDGVDCFHLNADDFFGAGYESCEPDALPNWVEEGDMPPLSDGSSTATSLPSDDARQSALCGSSDESVNSGEGAGGVRPPVVAPRRGRRKGFQQGGVGRQRGSGLDVRLKLQRILVVLFCRQLIKILELKEVCDSHSQELLLCCILNLKDLRRKYADVTDNAMTGKVWALARSGVVGALFKFKVMGARDNQARDANLALEVFLSETEQAVVCCSRWDEDCLKDGCSMQTNVTGALEEVMAVTGTSLPDLLALLSEDLRVSALNQGLAVMYGPSLCVVRREGGSWPFAVVRRRSTKTKGAWLCHACTQAAGTCTHSQAARDADGDDQSETSDDNKDIIGQLQRKKNRRSNKVFSTRPRPLVPSRRSIGGHAAVLRAAEMGNSMRLVAPTKCRGCGRKRAGERISARKGVIEFEMGAVVSYVEDWTCSNCKTLCVTDGYKEGLILCSQESAYTEVFMFQTTVNLCRNASSLTATSDLRKAYHQLLKSSLYPASLDTLRSLPRFRTAALLYIYLVVDGLPLAVSTCARCTRADGSLQFICFDGLQLGFKTRFKIPFKRVSLKLRPIKRASIMALMVSDTAVGRALGEILSTSTAKQDAIRSASVKTLTAVRGHVMALAVLAGDVVVPGESVNFAGEHPHADSRGGQRGWDPTQDGGVHPALTTFFREMFRCGRASRQISLTILSAPKEWRRKIPVQLMDRVKKVIADGDGDSDTDPDTADNQADGEELVDGIVATPAPVRRRHLSAFAFAVSDPILADAGGAAGEARREQAMLRPIAAVASTVGSAQRLVDFVRAVTVDPVVVWAPAGDWSAVNELVAVLSADPFEAEDLRTVLKHNAVKELRLLRGAVLSLYPALCQQPRVRVLLRNLLLAIIETSQRYSSFVSEDAKQKSSIDADGTMVFPTREDMAVLPTTASVHPEHFTHGWLRMTETWEQFLGVYGDRARDARNFLLTGEWAPSFPPLRPLPDFLSVAGSVEDEAPLCNHGLGSANQWTGGTFAGACTCTHPKTIGVVVLQGSESQRMPIEFVVQRMPSMPERIFYDFACATLKLALCRLPFAALFIAWLVDRFHWIQNHVWCSQAMNPDSYTSVDAQNTSASEEKNAGARRIQNFLRLMKQSNFILVTVYQQAVGNVIAMHRDKMDDDKKAADERKAAMERMPNSEERTLERQRIEHDAKQPADDWPLWYRKAFVDVDTEQGVASAGQATTDMDATSDGEDTGEDTPDARGGAVGGEWSALGEGRVARPRGADTAAAGGAAVGNVREPDGRDTADNPAENETAAGRATTCEVADGGGGANETASASETVAANERSGGDAPVGSGATTPELADDVNDGEYSDDGWAAIAAEALDADLEADANAAAVAADAAAVGAAHERAVAAAAAEAAATAAAEALAADELVADEMEAAEFVEAKNR